MDKKINNQNEKNLNLNDDELKNVSGGHAYEYVLPSDYRKFFNKPSTTSEKKSDKEKSSPELISNIMIP